MKVEDCVRPSVPVLPQHELLNLINWMEYLYHKVMMSRGVSWNPLDEPSFHCYAFFCLQQSLTICICKRLAPVFSRLCLSIAFLRWHIWWRMTRSVQKCKTQFDCQYIIYSIRFWLLCSSKEEGSLLKIFRCAWYFCCVHCMMKIYTDFNVTTWLRVVKFTKLNISDFRFLYFNYIGYHWAISKSIIISGISI